MKLLFVFLLSLLFCCSISLSSAQSADIEAELKTQDSVLFQSGYNKCDLSKFEDLLSSDFEFYHDQAGSIMSKAAFIESVKKNICGLSYKAERELIDTSLHAYVLKKNDKVYGGVQTGIHRFYSIDGNNIRKLTGTSKFTHVWLLDEGKWRLSRSISYDHDDEQPLNEQLLFKDRAETERWLEQLHIPALGLGYIENGTIVVFTVYGKKENGQPYPVNTIFNVASLTKPVTTLVALKLVNMGKWRLDEPLCHYWTDPDIMNDPRSKELTTRHILSHRTGFPNWRNDKLTFKSAPGTTYGYSGEGFEYLRKALENKFKKSLEQLANELIFEPLQMTDTRFTRDGVDSTRFAKWYRKDGTTYKTYKNTTANAADDLLTTVEDYSKFVAHVINGAGLSYDLYEQMMSRQADIKPHSYFGLGWIGYEISGNEVALQHGGDDIGVHTIVFMLPGSKKGLLLFTNCDNGTEAYISAIQHYLGKPGQEIIDIEMGKK